jgi:hypothetical protein
MRKLRLNVDAIVVETFHTAAGAPFGGTVHGAGYGAGFDVDRADSGGSDCDVCWSADPCTNIPIETCTCGCGAQPVTPGPGPGPVPVHTHCAATSACTCTPIETCSCAPNY